jgi:acyl CoA:acetate/3-ketoacid CoA transferase alpha subunit
LQDLQHLGLKHNNFMINGGNLVVKMTQRNINEFVAKAARKRFAKNERMITQYIEMA